MCGINGFINKSNYDSSHLEKKITQMNQAIFHRGPDDFGIYFDKFDGKKIALGMRRLSIIDIESGKQPIISEDGDFVIVYNGEIYNYLTLREEMARNSGIKFDTNSDTEVILKLYQLYGVECFNQLDGMFAFSIYDKRKNKVYICRDFFGEKPLYFCQSQNQIIWSSELKSLLLGLDSKPGICHEALRVFFQLSYIPAPYSIYDNVFKLRANHYLEIDIKKFNIKEHEVSNGENINQFLDISFETAKKLTYEKVNESVLSRSVSDVPIGTFLSGGVDSSIISLCLAQQNSQPIQTFSLSFDKHGFDESEKARLVSKLIGSKHHEFNVTSHVLKDDIHNVILNYDEPFADSSALPTYFVSRETRKHVKVVLTGDGGDELFGGYNKYYMGKLNNHYTNIVPELLHKIVLSLGNITLKSSDDRRGKRYKLNRLLESIDYNDNFYRKIISLAFNFGELSDLFIDDFNNLGGLTNYFNDVNVSNLSTFRKIDRDVSLEGDLLVKVDRASMLSSLECRSPFLNKELWQFTNGLPENYLIKNWNKKYLLKSSFEKFFPSDFLDKPKQGFAVPVGDWLRTILYEELKGFSEIKLISKQNLFNPSFVNEMINNHIYSKRDNTFKIWTYYCFQKWYFNSYLN